MIVEEKSTLQSIYECCLNAGDSSESDDTNSPRSWATVFFFLENIKIMYKKKP